MKRFRFPLDRVLQIRRRQEELERTRLETLTAERLRLERRALELEVESRQSRAGCGLGPGLPAWELRAAHDYSLALDRAREQTLRLSSQVGQQRSVQLHVLVRARRNVQLLEHLRQKQLADYHSRLDREQENFAAEIFLARLVRERAAASVSKNSLNSLRPAR